VPEQVLQAHRRPWPRVREARAAVCAGGRTLAVLGVQNTDARRLAPYFSGMRPEDLVERPTLHAAVYTSAASGTVVSFTMENPLPPPAVAGRRERIMALSDARDGVDAARVDAYIEKIYE
jgi:hypothetical protein